VRYVVPFDSRKSGVYLPQSGKTRLALALATEVAEQFPDGVGGRLLPGQPKLSPFYRSPEWDADSVFLSQESNDKRRFFFFICVYPDSMALTEDLKVKLLRT
jgi:hypothetical protein